MSVTTTNTFVPQKVCPITPTRARATRASAAKTAGSRESSVRYYHGVYPRNFVRGEGTWLYAEDGTPYLDFFCGAGALNFGHNHPVLKRALVDYLEGDGLLHALDLETPAREGLRNALDTLLEARGMDFQYVSPGPTGANAVETALKLARRATGRSRVIAFTGAFHGMSLGALSVTANRSARSAAGTALGDVTFFPFPDVRHPWTQHSLAHLESMLDDTHSGVDLPAAIIVESVQAEGGVNPAPLAWLRGLSALCRERGVLLISDDIQVGCTRTGFFFSFEAAGVQPDIVVMAKALSGLGLPLSLVLYRRELDALGPGEHTGTFRGNQLAFVSAALALPMLTSTELAGGVLSKGDAMAGLLTAELERAGIDAPLRYRGLILGVDLAQVSHDAATRVAAECFERGLLAEPTGRHDTVLKMLPPLNVKFEHLQEAAAVFGAALRAVVASPS